MLISKTCLAFRQTCSCNFFPRRKLFYNEEILSEIQTNVRIMHDNALAHKVSTV